MCIKGSNFRPSNKHSPHNLSQTVPVNYPFNAFQWTNVAYWIGSIIQSAFRFFFKFCLWLVLKLYFTWLNAISISMPDLRISARGYLCPLFSLHFVVNPQYWNVLTCIKIRSTFFFSFLCPKDLNLICSARSMESYWSNSAWVLILYSQDLLCFKFALFMKKYFYKAKIKKNNKCTNNLYAALHNLNLLLWHCL